MGYPRRFLGCDREITIDGVTIPPRCAVEVTFRAHQQRHLLRPDEEANEIILGCFGRAYHRYPGMNVFILNVLSNHGSFIALPESVHVMSSFMRDFLSTSATRLNGYRDRSGTFWERRYRSIPIVDEQALDNRFAYVLTQGTKENLVWSARDWPGVNCTKALTGGPQLVGRWRDGTAECALRRQRERKIERAKARGRTLELPEAPEVWREYPIELHPLPHWQDLKEGQRRARVAEILRSDDEATRLRHERNGTKPLGVRGVLRTDPFSRPKEPKKSPAPPCHASSPAKQKAFCAALRNHLDGLAVSRDKVTAKLPEAGVPMYATIPPLTRLPPPGSDGTTPPSSPRDGPGSSAPGTGPPKGRSSR